MDGAIGLPWSCSNIRCLVSPSRSAIKVMASYFAEVSSYVLVANHPKAGER
jgi:hypothetical protein